MSRIAILLSLVVSVATLGCGDKKGSDKDKGKPDKTNPDGVKNDPPKQPDKRIAPVLEGLGDHQYKITTSKPEAQKFFNQGLILSYGFNHAESARSFQQAALIDPDCAMCYWGEALVLGPNINAAMDDDNIPKAWAALQKALKAASKASEKEQALINALAKRYAEKPPKDRKPLDQAYADAMAEVHKKYPDDLDIATLYGEALMDLHPWNFWKKTAGEAQEWTPPIVALFESVLKKDENHPGANHLYIHVVEAGPTPKTGEPMADRLRTLVPGAGHLVHMPSHIYIRLGRYADASKANEDAIKADQAYLTQCRQQGIYPLAYHPHNFHFLFASSSLEGRSKVAIQAANHVKSKVPPPKMREQGWGTLQHYFIIPIYAMIRFGKWDEILAEKQPEGDLKYPNAIWRYARGMAYVGKGDPDNAAKELAELKKIATENAKDLEKITIWDLNPSTALVAIAIEVLEGEVLAEKKDFKKAIEHLTKAVDMEDKLTYDEPPDWYYPTRHNLGAVLLEAGKAKEAETVYREDLVKFPRNGWALAGLVASLKAQGKKRAKDAEEAQKQFDEAWANADIKLTASRF